MQTLTIERCDAGVLQVIMSRQVRELMAATIARVRGSDEAREGFVAFLDKRAARWTPKR